MNHDTVELDLPARAAQDTDSLPPLSGDDARQILIHERKRFDEERQQLRRQITDLKRVNFEREQQVNVFLEREKARLNQDHVQMTGELFALRRQLQDQAKLRAEMDRLQIQLDEARAAAETLRGELAASRAAAPARPLRVLPPIPRAAEEKAPEFLYEEPEADSRKHSFHTSGNPIPVRIAANGADDEDALSGWVVERSLGGCTLLLDQELPVGDKVCVRNARAACLLPTWIAVHVKQCQPHGNSFKVVCRFLERPTWEEIQQFWG